MNKFLYSFIVSVLLLASCSKEEGVTISRNNTGTVEQTTLMYFMGTSLRSDFLQNISDVETAVSSGALGDNGRFLVFLPNYSSGATLYEIYRTSAGCSTETIETYESNVSMDQDRIVDVVAKSKEFAPANTYNLILSGHGTGWVLTDHPKLKSSVEDDSYIDWGLMSSGDVVTRFLGLVGSTSYPNEGNMEISELRAALELTQTKFGYLLFDMCFMSNIETIYELKDLCDNVVASPCEVMGSGFPYETTLPELFANNGKTTDFDAVCYAYYYGYYSKTMHAYASAAVAMCETSELDALVEVIKRINAAGINSVSASAVQSYENLSQNVFFDLGHYISLACGDDDLYSEFEAALARAFPYKYSTTSFYTNFYGDWVDIDHFTGVSTSAPTENSSIQSEWTETLWAQAISASVE